MKGCTEGKPTVKIVLYVKIDLLKLQRNRKNGFRLFYIDINVEKGGIKMYHILYNPYAGNGRGEMCAKKLDDFYGSENTVYYKMTEIKNYQQAFFDKLENGDKAVIVGGDGTLNRFINDIEGIDYKCDIFYYASGSGNDFLKDLNKPKDCEPFAINKYIKCLPTVTINGVSRRFLNGIGYGIDGYCCEEGDKKRNNNGKPINYTPIALKGLLYDFKPVDAEIIIDGKRYTFEKIWLAPAMHGRFYGGGVMAAPKQDRLNDEGTLTLAVMRNLGRIRSLTVFPTLYSGKHVEHTDIVTIMTGKEITVSFNRPTALQIDGETVKNVTSYSVKSGRLAMSAPES